MSTPRKDIPEEYWRKDDGYYFAGGNAVLINDRWYISQFHMQFFDKGSLEPNDRVKWISNSKICYGIISNVIILVAVLRNYEKPYNEIFIIPSGDILIEDIIVMGNTLSV